MWLELGIILLTLLFVWHYKKVKEHPPGPFSLPIIGTIGLLAKGGGSKSGAVFAKEYFGYKDWYTIFVGNVTAVVLNDFQLCKELFSRDEFAGRESSWWHSNIRGINGRNLGIITTEGQTWTTQRRFALKQLRDLGFGKKSLDSIMVEEVDDIIEEMLKNGTVKMDGTFNTGIINVLWQIVASKRLDPNKAETKALMNRITEIVSAGLSPKSYLPKVLAKNLPYDKIDMGMTDMKKMMYDQIQEHLIDMDPDHPRDFIDVYLRQISQDAVNFDVEQLVIICSDFFFAGSETTA